MAAGGTPAPPEVGGMLRRAPIFSTLSDRQLTSVARTAKVVSFPAGARVVKQGEPGIGFYLLLSGGAEVRQGPRTLARLEPGQFFGEMTLLDEQPRSADVVAITPTQCAVLSRWEFWGFAKTEPEVIRGVLREMARRLRETDRALTE